MPHNLTEQPARRFWIVRQGPTSRSFHRVGELEAREDGEFRFRYLPDAPTAPNFRPLAAFPELDREYRSDDLFPYFSNRIMSARRPDFDAHLSALGLTREDWTPLELLARSAGGRATDTIQVVSEPVVDDDGLERLVFPVSGVRWIPGASERIARLASDQPLRIRAEPDNPFDCRALLLDAASDEPVGWIPGYLLDYVHKHMERGATVAAFVEQANGPETPSHIRLLCRLEVRPGVERRA